MASRGQNYAVGIGSGAAAGAASGTAILPGWGTLIGGVVGAGAGAIGAAVKSNDEDAQRDKLSAQQARERQLALVRLLRDRAAADGADTTALDSSLEDEGISYNQNLQNKQLALQQRLDPNAFVGMAQNLARTSGGIYRAANQPQQQQQLGGLPDYQSLVGRSDYNLGGPIEDERMQALRRLA